MAVKCHPEFPGRGKMELLRFRRHNRLLDTEFFVDFPLQREIEHTRHRHGLRQAENLRLEGEIFFRRRWKYL